MTQESETAGRLERHKAVIRRFYEELWNRWDFAVIGEILTPDIVFHGSLGLERTGHASDDFDLVTAHPGESPREMDGRGATIGRSLATN